MYGCTAVQVNHAVMAEGPSVITRINEGMENFLNEKGHEGIHSIIGMALPHVFQIGPFMDTFGQTKGVIVASNIPDRCIQCQICEESCPVYAITMGDQEPVIDKNLCEGCGLCVANCPSAALELLQLEYFYELAKGSS